MKTRRMSDIVRRKPVALPKTATVQRACQEMHTNRIGCILVVDDDQHLQGIFTGRDVVRLLAEGRNPAHTHLDVVMTPGPTHLPPGHNAIDALRLMHDGGFRHLPVVAEGCVVGLVSQGDFHAKEQERLDEETGIWERI
jgi:CBS domain-containing protein